MIFNIRMQISQFQRSIWIAFLAVLLSLTGCLSGSDSSSTPTADNSDITAAPVVEDREPLDSTIGPPLQDVALDDSEEIDFVVEGTGGNKPIPGPSTLDTQDGRAVLGPIISADVEIFDTEDLSSHVCKTQTDSEEAIETAGYFSLPEGCIYPNRLYLVVIKNGFDIDVDDDGILNSEDEDNDGNGIKDGEEDEDGDLIPNALDKDYSGGITGPHPVDGVFRALVTGEQMADAEFRVSAITEYVFEALQITDLNQSSLEQVLEVMDNIAPVLLGIDINEDGDIDANDIIAWEPDANIVGVGANVGLFSETNFSTEQIRHFIGLIHGGENTTQEKIDAYKRLVSHTNTHNFAERIQVDGSQAYVGTPGTILIYDIQNPKKPKLTGNYFTGPIRDFYVSSGTLLFIDNFGLNIVDLDLPTISRTNTQFPFNVIDSSFSDGRLVMLSKENIADDAQSAELHIFDTLSMTIHSTELDEHFTDVISTNNLVYVWQDTPEDLYSLGKPERAVLPPSVRGNGPDPLPVNLRSLTSLEDVTDEEVALIPVHGSQPLIPGTGVFQGSCRLTNL